LCKLYPQKIHLECAATEEMKRIALKYKPASVCLVPEFKGERTTRGGLGLDKKSIGRIAGITKTLQSKGIRVSLFIDPAADSVRAAKKTGAEIVEFCTAAYSAAQDKKTRKKLLEDLAVSSILACELELEVHAGHGLDYTNVKPVAVLNGMSCLNIGFAIISTAVFIGLSGAVSEMLEVIKEA
jgi:pyridoxine 5-phosphate synthase